MPRSWRLSRPAGKRARSEEGRGGEEGRSRWAPYHLKKKKKVNLTARSFTTKKILLILLWLFMKVAMIVFSVDLEVNSNTFFSIYRCALFSYFYSTSCH